MSVTKVAGLPSFAGCWSLKKKILSILDFEGTDETNLQRAADEVVTSITRGDTAEGDTAQKERDKTPSHDAEPRTTHLRRRSERGHDGIRAAVFDEHGVARVGEEVVERERRRIVEAVAAGQEDRVEEARSRVFLGGQLVLVVDAGEQLRRSIGEHRIVVLGRAVLPPRSAPVLVPVPRGGLLQFCADRAGSALNGSRAAPTGCARSPPELLAERASRRRAHVATTVRAMALDRRAARAATASRAARTPELESEASQRVDLFGGQREDLRNKPRVHPEGVVENELRVLADHAVLVVYQLRALADLEILVGYQLQELVDLAVLLAPQRRPVGGGAPSPLARRRSSSSSPRGR
eukprot:CAMPEP_0185718242 /NCGR_PEP_ID=MMETSP1164-20130828/46339_1 /TAXON_ID=1104430 /ORGANISM="Chrysoreinhardia sp, Strain CCMP2950" /LENGTH=350 /DNA_ID=CAMNT_0028385885 /DNA_START=147 /DNA_END=1197 /DNA_ORIENTATION=+